MGRNKRTVENFVVRARSYHGDKYDYSLVHLAGSRDVVQLKCKNPNHNAFTVKAESHLHGKGCPRCSVYEPRKEVVYNRATRQPNTSVKTVLYFIRIWSQEEVFYKVGITTRSIEKRALEFCRAKYAVELVYSREMDYSSVLMDTERYVIERFSANSYVAQHFFKGRTELLSNVDPSSVIAVINESIQILLSGKRLRPTIFEIKGPCLV